MKRAAWQYSLSLTLALSPVSGPAPAQAQLQVDELAPADTVRPGTNRLFFAPTGRTLPAGVSEAGAYHVIAPYFS